MMMSSMILMPVSAQLFAWCTSNAGDFRTPPVFEHQLRMSSSVAVCCFHHDGIVP